MLESDVTAPLPSRITAYVHETLGSQIRIGRWADTGKLPYFLQDAFDLFDLELNGRPLLVAIGRRERLPPPGTLRIQLSKLAQIAERPVIFAATSLASYERRRLVEQKIPFVVPGNQLYLPDLGIDFREYFRQPEKEVVALSPATQAIFIAALLQRNWNKELNLAEVSDGLGYTAMTLSRAARELIAAGLARADRKGRSRALRANHAPAEAWNHATPVLRNPVKRTLWVSRRAGNTRLPLAGLSALAAHSMLVEPEHPAYAITAADWKKEEETTAVEIPAPEPDAAQWQVWSYSPNLGDSAETVDLLSLTLSLKDERDERVHQALGELREKYPW